MSEKVWYVAYGSNLCAERMNCYIEGGVCRFNGKRYGPCTDRTLPSESFPVELPYPMYFGNKSHSWEDGGVAFLDKHREGKTLARAYLITEEQLHEIHKQEGSGPKWYKCLIDLPDWRGHRACTISACTPREKNKPSEKYLRAVMAGLRETYPEKTPEELDEYMNGCLNRDPSK